MFDDILVNEENESSEKGKPDDMNPDKVDSDDAWFQLDKWVTGKVNSDPVEHSKDTWGAPAPPEQPVYYDDEDDDCIKKKASMDDLRQIFDDALDDCDDDCDDDCGECSGSV